MFYYLLTFIGGLFIGSFLNLVSDRVVNGDSILYGRSKCNKCNHALGPKDLIPLLSFVLLRGRCRYCNTKLSYYYPLSEILTGLVFVGIAYYTGLFGSFSTYILIRFIYLTVIGCVYMVLLLTDLKYNLIPDKVSFFGIGFVLLFLITSVVQSLWTSYNILAGDTFGRYLLEAGFWNNSIYAHLRQFGILILSSFVIAFFFWFLVFITKGRGMGGGDIKLGFLIGLVNGFPYNFLAIFLGFLFGSVFSLVALLLRRKTVKDTIPFGPFLIAGSVVAFVWGENLLNWYFNLFHI